MINERYGIAMAETLYYLKGINQNDINKIPNKFIKFLEDNSSKSYKCDFDYTKPLKDLSLSNETKGIIAMICLNYWCKTKEEKENFKKHLNDNEIKYQEELREKYNPDDIFKKKKQETEKEEIQTEEKSIAVIREQKWYQKIFNLIKGIFRRG